MYPSGNYVVFDLEIDTAHGDYGHPVHPENSCLLACWELGPDHPFQDAGSHLRHKWGDEFHQQALLAACESADFLVAHNAKYDMGWLYRMGLDIRQVTVFDTQLAEYVLMGNLAAGDQTMAPRSLSLDACILRRGGEQKDPVVDKLIKAGVNPRFIPKTWLQGRCEKDVQDTHWLFRDQMKMLERTQRLPVLSTRCRLTPFLTVTEFTGMCLDSERVAEVYEEYSRRMVELDRELEEFTGGINWKSPMQMAEYLYTTLEFDRPRKAGGALIETATGLPPTDKKTLDRLQARTPEQKTFLALRQEAGKVNAALTKNLEFFRLVCEEQGGIFHATFNQARTATHRLSSSGIPIEDKGKRRSVQFQNLPNAFKPVFKARRPDWLVGEVDGSQLEFRTAAQLTGDPQAVSDILDPDFDAHIQSASVMRKVPYEELLRRYRDGDKAAKKQRRDAKADTFGPLFGKTSGSAALQAWIKAFWERYNVMYERQQANVHEVLDKKRMTTPWGLRFYWPYARMNRSGYVNVQRAVFNYWIQSFATAEIIPIAIDALWRRITEANAEDIIIPVNTVHDSLICEIHPDAIPLWKDLATKAFTTDVYEYLEEVYDYEFDLVPLGVGFNYGSHWSDVDNVEEEYNVFRDSSIKRVA